MILPVIIAFHLGAAAAFFLCAATMDSTPGARTGWVRLVLICLAWPVTVPLLMSNRWSR